MKLRYKLIDYEDGTSKMHYVRAVDYAHLLVSWPMGTSPKEEDVSQGLYKQSPETVRLLLEGAEKLANGFMEGEDE